MSADGRGQCKLGLLSGLLTLPDPLRLGVVRQDARGPQLVGQLSGLLVRFDSRRVGAARRQDSQDLGYKPWQMPADAQRPSGVN